ncbi:hypothetical protein KCU71_g176, partial [Aureobasidium melanogenum]
MKVLVSNTNRIFEREVEVTQDACGDGREEDAIPVGMRGVCVPRMGGLTVKANRNCSGFLVIGMLPYRIILRRARKREEINTLSLLDPGWIIMPSLTGSKVLTSTPLLRGRCRVFLVLSTSFTTLEAFPF